MNVTINSQHLAAELRLLNRVVPSKPVIPILSHVLLTAEAGLQLYATDLEVGLTCNKDADVAEAGVAAVPAARLLAMVEQFTDGDVNLSIVNGQFVVRCGAFKSRLQAMKPDDFPVPPEMQGEACTIDAATLRWLFGKARYAAAQSATKMVLQGTRLKMEGGVAQIVGCDSKRLAVATATCGPAAVQVIVPSKTIDLLMGQLTAGDVELTQGKRHTFFNMDHRLLASRTIDGQYPAIERIVPRDNDKHVTIDKATLSAALRRVILAAEENGAVYFNVTPGKVGLTSASAGVGSAEEEVGVEYEGPPIKVCINGEYVLDFLNAAQEPSVVLMLKDANTAALLQDGRDSFGVIMLMKA